MWLVFYFERQDSENVWTEVFEEALYNSLVCLCKPKSYMEPIHFEFYFFYKCWTVRNTTVYTDKQTFNYLRILNDFPNSAYNKMFLDGWIIRKSLYYIVFT